MAKQNAILSGDKELDKQLRNLSAAAGKKLWRKATRKAAKKLSIVIKAALPRGETKQLAKTVKVRALKRSRVRFGHQVLIGGDAAAYVAKVELGTRYAKEGRQIRDSVDGNAASVQAGVKSDIQAELSAEVAKG